MHRIIRPIKLNHILFLVERRRERLPSTDRHPVISRRARAMRMARPYGFLLLQPVGVNAFQGQGIPVCLLLLLLLRLEPIP